MYIYVHIYMCVSVCVYIYIYVMGVHITIPKLLDCSLEISEFVLQSLYYVLFWTNFHLSPQVWIK